MSLPELRIMKNSSAMREIERGHILRHASERGDLNIIEAGCGRRWPYEIDGINFKLTGIDLDEDALKIRKNKLNDLDITILGDLRSVELAESSYDVIYSAFVLEHIDGAQVVLDNFLRWLRPGGLMILKFPDRDSVYGFITRITPFWFHVFYKKYIMRRQNAGKPGFPPYPTYHNKIISRRAFLEFAKENNLSILEEIGTGRLPRFQMLITRILDGLSFGKLSSSHIDLLYVLEKSRL